MSEPIILSFASTHPHLTHCSDCGQEFAAPVSEETALKHFPSLDVASYSCSFCVGGSAEEPPE